MYDEKSWITHISFIFSLQERLSDYTGEPLLSPSRQYVREGQVFLSARFGSKFRYLLCFSDLLLVAKQRRQKFKFERSFQLRHCRFEQIEAESNKFPFTIVTGDTSLKVWVPKEPERDSWLATLRQLASAEASTNSAAMTGTIRGIYSGK